MPHPCRAFACLAPLLLAGCTALQTAAMQPFTTDGCSLFPDRAGAVEWCDCCLVHDLVYWRGGTEAERLKADEDLRACVARASGSEVLAGTMFAGVRAGGSPSLNTPFRWGYGRATGKLYEALSADEKAQADRYEAEYRKGNPKLMCRPS